MPGLRPFKDIEPSPDALDEHLKKHGSKPIAQERTRIMRCVNRMIRPHKLCDKRHIYDSWGCVIAMKCYASKRWIPFEGPKACEFGKRRGHKSGYNKMTAKARKVWEAHTKEYNKVEEFNEEQCRLGIITESVKIERIAEAALKRFNAFQDWDEGFISIEECIEYLKKHGLLV